MIERYTRPEMGKIWTPENRYQAWLRVELAVCEAWNRVGEISDADMETLRKEADFTVDRAFVDRANEIEETTRHDVIAFLTAIEEKVGPVSRFIHLGCTSSDIVDTAGSLLMVEAGELILKAFDRVLAVLKKMTLEHQGLLCMGRTHGIHAEPTSFSLKMAGFYAEFKRDRARFAAALDDMRVGKLSGAVGTYTVLSPEVEAIVCDLLGLKVDEVSTQVIQRDRHAAYFTALAVTAGTIERLCVELRHLQRTEVREVEEGFGKGQKGSSAMPHKKNPISAENMTGHDPHGLRAAPPLPPARRAAHHAREHGPQYGLLVWPLFLAACAHRAYRDGHSASGSLRHGAAQRHEELGDPSAVPGTHQGRSRNQQPPQRGDLRRAV